MRTTNESKLQTGSLSSSMNSIEYAAALFDAEIVSNHEFPGSCAESEPEQDAKTVPEVIEGRTNSKAISDCKSSSSEETSEGGANGFRH